MARKSPLAGLLSRGLQVRALPGAPIFQLVPELPSLPELAHFTLRHPESPVSRVRRTRRTGTSRTPCASSTTAGSEYLAHSVREFSYGTIILRCLSECGDEAPDTVGRSPVCSGCRITALKCAAVGRVRRTQSATGSRRASVVVV